MKNVPIFLAVIFLIMNGCSGGFSKGVKVDALTGLSTSYNGFHIEDIYLTSNNEKLSGNSASLGSKIKVVATGVDYYTEKDGKVFPGCRIVLTDKDKKEILNIADAFADMIDGTTVEQARTLEASLQTGAPMVAGEKYHLSVRFFDKNKNENEIVSDVDLLMK